MILKNDIGSNVYKTNNVLGLKVFFLVAWIMSLTHGMAQTDSLILSYDEYLENILLFHPVAKQAGLKPSFADAEMMGAKGQLDPTLEAGWDQKQLDEKLYYRKYQAKLRFPTRLGIDVVGGYENTEGVYLNPENKTDEFGLWNVGVEVNVLNGLFTNERNTAIRQAEVYQDLAKSEQDILLNDLMYDALVAYLTWQKYDSFKDVLNENISLAQSYFNNTRQSFLQGEKTAMDTLEAYITFQEAVTFFNDNELFLIKSVQNVENYLWFNDIPIGLEPSIRPEDYRSLFLSKNLDYVDIQDFNHPKITAKLNKLSLYEIEQRLKREKLKPKLKFKYNPLLTTSENVNIHEVALSNYKLGFDLSMPIFFRKERAAAQKGELKIQEIEWDIEFKKNELFNKMEASWEQQALLRDQIKVINQIVDNYRRLLDGENEKFNYGESSVFLLNKRQEKYINGQLKLTGTYIKHQVEILNFLYYSNQLLPQ